LTGEAPSERGKFEREWRRRFENFARDATAQHEISGWSEPGLRRRVRGFEELLASEGLASARSVLDLGTGAGTYVRLLADRGHRTVGVDYSIESLHRARSADPGGAGQYVGAAAYELPFADGEFDLVVMIGIFQALSEPDRAIDEVRRILRPGGHLILEILNYDEIFIRARALFKHAREKGEGVRFYRRGPMKRRLRSHGFRPVADVPIYLPPRKYPVFERVLEHPLSRSVLHSVPGLSLLGAAAFLMLCRREAALPQGTQE
jgi:SAM-dependent methyltransferase